MFKMNINEKNMEKFERNDNFRYFKNKNKNFIFFINITIYIYY